MKTKIFAVIALLGILSLGVASWASAQTTTSSDTSSTPVVKALKVPGPRVEISPSGEANITGSVTGVSGNSISIQSWGSWSVSAASGTVIAGIDVKGDISQIKVGDVIGVHGKFSADSNSLSAKVIKDFSLNKTSGEIQNKGDKDGEKEVKQGQGQNVKEDVQQLLKNKTFMEKLKEFFLSWKKSNSTSTQ